MLPAVVTFVAGVLGMVTMAAGPWLLLYLYMDPVGAAAEQPAFQAARTLPGAESKRIIPRAPPALRAGRQGGTQEAGVSLVAGPSQGLK
jgi:hypothetical protein